MKNIKLWVLLVISVLFTSCFVNRQGQNPCPQNKPLFKNYKPRLQGSQRWNYKKYSGPRRKVIR